MDWKYLAGFFDGEGYIGIMSTDSFYFAPRVQISQSAERGRQLLEEIQVFLSARGIKSHSTKPRIAEGNKPMYNLYTSSRKDLIAFVENILPYLKIKKPEAQDAWRFLKMFPSRSNRPELFT